MKMKSEKTKMMKKMRKTKKKKMKKMKTDHVCIPTGKTQSYHNPPA
jgi:hypothetical protein